MLDLKFVREHPEVVAEALRRRGVAVSLREFLVQDQERRELLQTTERLKSYRNQISEEIGRRKRAGEEVKEMVAEMQTLGEQIKALDAQIKQIEFALNQFLLEIPNLPHSSVPYGEDARANEVVRTWGELPVFAFPPHPHWEIGTELGLIDLPRAGKVTGARFVFYKGKGARLERALVNFMLDLHIQKHGYEEVFPPFLVNRESMIGTGQLPKFAEEAFKVEGRDYYLIPTAEVPVTNFYREESIPGELLPISFVAYSACFRAEAGAHGKDTRGLIRQHQFNKVELVKFTTPETSYLELEKLTADAEEVLQLLGLPYRVVNLCTGDLGFAAAKTYDLEVWFPSAQEYREVSSCSNFEDYQARRANIRYRPTPKAKPRFVHTLNGSGLAIGRTFAALLENYQQADGTVIIPPVLRPYLGNCSRLTPETRGHKS